MSIHTCLYTCPYTVCTHFCIHVSTDGYTAALAEVVGDTEVLQQGAQDLSSMLTDTFGSHAAIQAAGIVNEREMLSQVPNSQVH